PPCCAGRRTALSSCATPSPHQERVKALGKRGRSAPTNQVGGIGADCFRQGARLDKGLTTDRDPRSRGARRTPCGQRGVQDRWGGSQVTNLQERIFLLSAVERSLDDQLHLPQLRAACGATRILEPLALAVSLPGTLGRVMPEAFDRAPMWNTFESATVQLPWNEWSAPTWVFPFGFQDCFAHTSWRLMWRRLWRTPGESFKPWWTEVAKPPPAFPDATQAPAELLGHLREWSSTFLKLKDRLTSLTRCLFSHQRSS